MPDGEFRYPSYVQDIMGPICFDYGFGPFRWICCSNDPADLAVTDRIAVEQLVRLAEKSPDEIKMQLEDNIHWIREAAKNKLVVGSQARILYADSEGRIAIAEAFNNAIAKGEFLHRLLLEEIIMMFQEPILLSGKLPIFMMVQNLQATWRFRMLLEIHSAVQHGYHCIMEEE